MKIDFSELITKAEAMKATAAPTFCTSSGAYSLGVVNSSCNGKRVTLSKALAQKLELNDQLHILPMPDEGVVLLAKHLPFDAAGSVQLSGDGKKIAYSASLVAMLTEAFKLDYSSCTSRSFSTMEFSRIGDVTVAAVTLSDITA